jgi:hypothetical protein
MKCSIVVLCVFFSVVVVTALPCQAAGVINGCVIRSSGQIRIVASVSQCRSNEIPLTWNLQGPAGGQADFVVVDSTGKSIGPVIGTMQFGAFGGLTGGLSVVALPFEDKWLQVFVRRSTFEAPILLYTSPDCTGQPFGATSPSPFLATGVSADNTLYYESGPSQSITTGSIFDIFNSSCSSLEVTMDAVPMAPAIDLKVFTPPFRVTRSASIP